MTGDFQTDLERLRDPADGFMDEVHALREQYGADAVALLVARTQLCGKAHQMEQPSAAFSSMAFSVTSSTCATFQGYVLGAADADNARCMNLNRGIITNWSNQESPCNGMTSYWDLRFELLGAPTSAAACSTVDWLVRVSNHGNLSSPPVCARTGICANGGETWGTCLPLALFSVPPLQPYQDYVFAVDSYHVGDSFGCGNVLIGGQYIKAGIDTFSGCFDNCPIGNLAEHPIQILGPDVSVEDVAVPSGLVGGFGGSVYDVALQNHGSTPANVQLDLDVGTNLATVFMTVPAGQSVVESVFVLTPPVSTAPCGGSTLVPVTATAYSFPDANPSNNAHSTSVPVEGPFWDLRFDVVGEPSSTTVGHSFSYDVRVTNVGNVPSPNVCAITGITLNPGAGNWSWNLGIGNFTTPNIAPWSTWTFHNNYFVPFGALCNTTQYLKAEVHYSAGCFDNCGSGNFDQEPIYISYF